jgi:putative transposase
VLTVVAEDGQPRGDVSLLDDIVREGARRMLAAALEAEVDAYLAELVDERDERGRRLVVRNGHARPRQVMTSAGAVQVAAPRVNDKRTDAATGQRQRFRSAILPPWCRKSPRVAEVLPLLYLHGLSSGDFVPALEQFLGSAAGLSSATITRLTNQWSQDYQSFSGRDLSGVDYVYVWADGVHVNVRLQEARLCLLVVIGVRADGRKELVALADGYRESAESWADLLRDRAPGPSTHVEPDRVHFRHGAPPHQSDQGPGQPCGRAGHGVQADRSRPGPVAGRSTHHTSSPLYAPAQGSSTASSSSDPRR